MTSKRSRVRQSAKERRLEMIRCDQVLLSPTGCDEERDLRIVRPSGQKLQGQKRVRGAALAQVELDCVWRPNVALLMHDHEVDREAADDPLA